MLAGNMGRQQGKAALSYINPNNGQSVLGPVPATTHKTLRAVRAGLIFYRVGVKGIKMLAGNMGRLQSKVALSYINPNSDFEFVG